jgi:phosphoglycolate phosphatase
MISKNYYFFIFDLDGVIFDSKKNMNYAWNLTKKKFNLKPDFKEYFKYLGLPFDEILLKLKIKLNKKIKNFYYHESQKNINQIKLYKGVKKFLNILAKKKIKFSIVTSKNYMRSKNLLRKFNINPASLHCPRKNIKSKPYPDQLLLAIKKNKFKNKKKYACYVGDTKIDYSAAKAANIDFIFASYGYGKLKNKVEIISKFSELKKFL